MDLDAIEKRKDSILWSPGYLSKADCDFLCKDIDALVDEVRRLEAIENANLRLRDEMAKLREERNKAEQERDEAQLEVRRLEAQVAKWEKHEVCRASCCIEMERERDEARAHLRYLLLRTELLLRVWTNRESLPDCPACAALDAELAEAREKGVVK